MLPIPTSPLVSGRKLRAAGLVLLLCALTACKTSVDAIPAANQLTTVSQQLTAYYTDLEQQIADTVVLNQIQATMLGLPFDDSDRAQLETTRQELDKRANMAKAVATLAAAYSALAGSKSGADISAAAGDLAKQFVGMKRLPGGPSIPDVISQVGQALVESIRTKKLQQSSEKIAQAVAAIQTLFDRETPTYESINRQRIVLAQSLATMLIEKDMVDISAALTAALKPFGLTSKLPSGQTPAEVKRLAEAEIKSSGELQIATYEASTKALSESLAAAAKKVDAVAKEH